MQFNQPAGETTVFDNERVVGQRFTRIEGPPRDLVDHGGPNRRPALAEGELEWRTLAFRPEVVLAVAPHGDQYIARSPAFLGEDILVSHRVLLIRNLLYQPLIDESGEPRRERGPADIEVLLEVLEPPYPEERIPEDDRCPPVAEQIGDAGDGARVDVETSAPHTFSNRARTCLWCGVPANQSRSSTDVSSLR